MKNKTWHFFIHLPLIYFKIILPKHIFDYHPIPEKNQIGKIQDMEFEGVLKKQAEIPESIKKEVDFLGVIKKKSCGFSIGLGISKGCSSKFWNFQGWKLVFLG